MKQSDKENAAAGCFGCLAAPIIFVVAFWPGLIPVLLILVALKYLLS